MNLVQMLFGGNNRKRKRSLSNRRKTRRETTNRKRSPKFVPGKMKQRVRLVEPDVAEWSLVYEPRKKAKR